MTLFGKDPEYLEVVTADFLPDGKKLYILVADSDCNLHVLQYDPEGKYIVARPILYERNVSRFELPIFLLDLINRIRSTLFKW